MFTEVKVNRMEAIEKIIPRIEAKEKKDKRDWDKRIKKKIKEDKENVEKTIIKIVNKKELSEKEMEIRDDVLLLLISKKRGGASERLVESILNNIKIYTTRNDVNEEVWIYKEGIYVPQGKTYIKEKIRRILEGAYTNQIYNEVLNKIEADTYIDQDEFFNNKNIWEIPVQNGILNLKTRELYDFTDNKIFFSKLPMDYNPDAKCPNISKHFREVLSTEPEVTVMEEIIGTVLLKDYRIEKAIMMLGGGRNGKGKTLELIKRFVGADNCSAVALKNMREDRFHIKNMFGKLVNLSGDLSNISLKETGCLKQLIGRDIISGDRKNKEMINFINYAKIIFAANELPRVYDSTDGFWDKWVLLEFPYKFIPQKEFDSLSKSDKINKKIIDPDHIKKISSNDEFSGLLNLALDGLDRTLENNNFSYSSTGNEIREFWIRKSNSFAGFCMDCIVADYDGFISKKDLRNKFSKYCKILRLPGVGDKTIKTTLNEEYGSVESRKYDDFLKNQERVWEGVKFIENIDNFLKNTMKNSISPNRHSFSSCIEKKISLVSIKTMTNMTNLKKTQESTHKFSDEDIKKSGLDPKLIKKTISKIDGEKEENA